MPLEVKAAGYALFVAVTLAFSVNAARPVHLLPLLSDARR